MMENWVRKRSDFEFVLCLDVSRWGRFQDIDLSATYSAECKKHGKQVIYTTLGMPRPDDPLGSSGERCEHRGFRGFPGRHPSATVRGDIAWVAAPLRLPRSPVRDGHGHSHH
jgi:hypothetical protein